MTDLDDINRELAEVVERLNALPADAFAERFELRTHQDALRERAAQFRTDWDARRRTPELVAELAALRARLADIERQRIDLVTQSGSTGHAGPGADALGAVAINQGIEAAQGAPSVRARIGRIKGILVDRGVDPDDTEHGTRNE